MLACKKSDHLWESCSELLPFSAQLDYSVEPNTTMFVFIEIDEHQKIQSLNNADEWIFATLRKSLTEAPLSAAVVETEKQRVETWRQEITATNLELTRQRIELETQREQLQSLEISLKQEQDQLKEHSITFKKIILKAIALLFLRDFKGGSNFSK
ncbi:MAG: hypothetical protein KA717_05815 [Woronichinia naegeliana WA131]|uniref:Uncharacterized protein n=1 Tax=Woronichinia naegeliana WA131 TaxID=2824559 RepID=A0A977PYC0_9CYAN|nr:MAG: hypothetical protein KA717_05815 [Woronichinia naegeliana WA131]